MQVEITVKEIVGIIFIIAGLVIIFMNFVGALEGLAGLALLFIGLYFAGLLK